MTGIGALDLLWLLLLGGWVATDSTSFAQLMVSRPLISASLAGWIAGDPVAGASLGVVLEAFHLGVLPFGAARYPEAGPAAVVAGAAYAGGETTPSAMVLVVAFALCWEWVCGQSVHQLRQFNVRVVTGGGPDHVDNLQRRHLTATALDFLRGVLLVAAGGAILVPLLRLLLPLWGLEERLTALLLGGMLVGLLASSWRVLGGRAAWFAVGVGAGAVLVLVAG